MPNFLTTAAIIMAVPLAIPIAFWITLSIGVAVYDRRHPPPPSPDPAAIAERRRALHQAMNERNGRKKQGG